MTVLESHYEPKPIVVTQRFHFHRRNQLPTENIVQYMAELRRLSTHSSFGPYLNEALRDRLVCGLRSDNIQKRLLSVKDLTLKVALDTALSMEAADSTASALHGRDAQVNILHKNKRKFTRQRESCVCLSPGTFVGINTGSIQEESSIGRQLLRVACCPNFLS